MGDGQASIHSPLQGSENLVASAGSGEPCIQVAGECTWLTVDALHVELISSDLHLSLVHLVQAELVQQLEGKTKTGLEESVVVLSQADNIGSVFSLSKQHCRWLKQRSFMTQLVEHHACNAKIVGSIPMFIQT